MLPSTRAGRRLGGVAISLVLVLVSLGGAGAPAGAAPSETPALFAALSYSDGVRLYYRLPNSIDGKPLVEYFVHRRTTGANGGWGVHDARMLVDTTAERGTTYHYAVSATTADTTTLESAEKAVEVNGGRTDLKKFTSPTAFVTRQFQTFLGRAPSLSETSAMLGSIGAGRTAANRAFLDSLINDESRAARQRVARLYLAYFKRSADHGGLAYWTAQLQAGTKTINDVSDSFARSNEFRTTYGTLSNRDFVTLVYANVLGRDPEPSGATFWVGQLDQMAAVRGRVMTQFSESNEFRTTSKTRVQASEVWDAMVGTNIPAATFTNYVGHLDGGGDIGDLALLILSLPVYHGDKS